MSSFSIRILFVLALISACRTSFFRDGFDHHYVYKAKSDFLGMHNVTTIIKFHVQRQNVSEAGNHVNVLWLDSFVQFSQAGEYADNPMQWNLSRPFLFTVSPRGIVLHVFVHPEEQDEVSTLKKVISSTFSANVIIKNDTQWTYSSTDNDHIGVLSHEYSVKRTGSGLRLTRYHRSVEHVERIHAKTMHLDNFGTVESVEGEDSIILENRLNSDFETKRIPYPEEYVIKTTEEGDIGVIKANAAINVKLLSKRRTRPSTRKPIEYNGLRLDKVLYQKNKIQKHPLASLEANIKAAITCSHQYTDKSNTNRTICVNNLRQNITALNEMDYESLVSKFLSKVCDPNDTKCEDERFLFIDIVAREGDDLSQKLIVKYALQEKPLDEEAIRRALIHFTTLVKPIPETVAAVEKLCFGENNEHHGSVKMTLTAQRACLALGVLVKALSNIGNDTEATVIMDKLHRWLYKQGDETPEHLRPRRSTINVDVTVSSDHLLSKFVLLHSLGNAAQPSSLPHLHEYAKPNSRIPAWRRAALSAMKYDKSNKTAQVLLDSLTFEKTETVRATAMEQFLAHPLQHNFTKSLSDILLSQNYSYPTVVRLKRAGDLNDVLLEFKVELPEVHWGKSVGNAKVGASFGIDMVNRMHLRIKPLSGFFHINIWDRVYAEAHVGILGIHVDILRIEACYRGKLEYNLNILKDFSYGEAQRDFDEYDQAASAIVSPIVNAVDGISEHFKKQSGHQSVFKPLTDSVKDIPVKARMFLDSSLALLSVLDSYQGIALVSRAKLLAFKVQGLAEDIKADTLNFYNEIADTALIVLPHAETQITEASNMMIDAQKKLGSEPQQAFETINMAKQRIKKATYQIIKAKSAIQNALSPHGGSLPTWISSQDELKMAISAAQALLTETKSLRKYFEAVTEEDIDNFVNWQGLTDIQTAVERVVTDMENLRADVEPFHVVVTDTLLKMQKIKLSVDKLDKKTKETQNNVKKSFGPKFNLAFPAQRRETDSRCGRGVWPSYTGGRYDDTPGIDVIVEEREKVVCPVNGKVFRTCEDDEVRIVPFDENFKMFTILIRNIRLEDSISANGSEFKAGQTLGHGKGKSGCSDPYIHVAMRKNAASGASTCSYVDPSSYVDNIKPFPKWQEECKEFIFKHIGNVIEAGLSGLGFEEIVEELAKRAMAWAGAEMVQKIVTHFPKSPMAKIAGTMAFAYLSQYNAEIGNAFMQAESQSELMDKKCEEMKKATTTPPTTSVEPPKQSFSTGKQEVNKVLENLQGDESLQRSRQAIHDVINRLNSSSSNIKLDDMSSMAFSRYGKILHKLNIPYKGGKQSMETTIQMLTWNVCPTFENGIAQGYGHLCVPTDGCFGLNCTIRIPDGIRKETVTLGVLFNRSDLTFTLFTTNYATEIAVDGTRKQHNVQNIMPGYDVTLFSHTNMVNISVGKAYQLTVSVVPCDTSAKCLPEVHIFHNLTFLKHQQQRQIRSSGNGCSFSADVGIQNVGHIGGSLELDKSGHVSGGGVDLGVKAGNVNIDGGFHMNNQGEWGADVGADVDLGDGKSVGTEMYLEGKGDDLTLGLGIEAQLGQSGSIGGFIEGNTDGELSAGISGQVNIGNSNISGSGYIHHDKNGTSGGGMVAANINGKGQIAASLNASSDGKIDAEIRGSAQIGNSTISGAGYIHHNQNGTSGGGIVGANINGKGQIAASLNASSDGTINAGVSGSAHIGNSTISGTGYIHHDRNGTSGGGMVAANINGKGQIAASLNASSDGTIDAGASGSAQIGNSTISGAGYIHHDQNGTSGGGMVGANINGKGQIAASLNASSDGSIDAGASGSAQIGNSTISGAGYIHHDQNGTSGGGMVGANINGKGQIAASVNASSDGTIDAGASGSAHIGNSTISGTGYIHHDKNGTSGGGMGAANINGKGQIAASLNASSDGSIDAGASGSAQIGNSTISGAGYIHHDQNGTSGGGMVGANINGKGQIAASVNASSDGTIDAGASGSAHIGNSTISGTGYIHHDKNGTSGGGMGAANINGKGQIAASLNASSDGTIDTGASGSAQIGNSTISGAGYIHHDQNGTSGGGMVGANINGKGQIAASLNASSDGSIDAGAIGSAQIGNSTISGAGYIHHDENGTSGGGMVGANINGKGQIAASVNASSDGTIDAGASGSAHIGNSTISGTGYIHHDKNGTSGGGMAAANINGKGQIAASLNASSDGTIDAGASGSAQIGNSTISGAGYIHHDQNGTSGGGMVGANINGKGQIAASLNASSDGKIDTGASGSAQIGNSTISGAGYIHHDKNCTSGGGMVAANINGKGQIAASLNASSEGTIDAGASGSAQIGNSTFSGAGYIHHDQNGTSGGGMVGANINGKGQIAASLNASSDGSIDAGAIGSAQIGNSTISGAGYIHHDQNGTSGSALVGANINGKGKIAASVNASSDGTIDAGASGSAHIGNSTISGTGYIHHDKNGTSGGGMAAANINGKGQIAASLNASSDGTIDAGASGSAHIGNSTISGTGYIHHDKNGTSGGGMAAANINDKGQIAASLNASSDGTIDAGASGSAQIGNSTISGAGYIHHDQNGTNGGGMVGANINGKGQIAASVNASSDGTIDAGASGSAHIGNSTISGTGYIHHDQNGTSGGGMAAANINGEGQIAASLNASSDGTIDARASGSALIGNSTISGTGDIYHDKNGTSGSGVKTDDDDSIHILKTRSANKCSVGLSANVGENGIGIDADANIPGFGKVGAHVTFKDGQIQGDLKIGDFSLDLGDAQKLTMDTFNQLASDLNINSDTTDVMSGFREGMQHEVCTSEMEITVGYETETMEEDFPARDRKDGVIYKDKHTDITIFKLEYTFGVGPIGIKLAFGAGGAIGTSMWSDIHANKGTAAFSIGPWVSGMVWGGLSIELGIASGGLKLIGYILKTKFPVTMETKSNKHPLTVVMNIDLELTPIELSLRGWAKVFFAKVFDKCLWKWACPPITWNILRKELENRDKVPPQFVNGSFCGNYRGKRSNGGLRECSVRQIPNRHPSDTAFQLEVSATDDDSSVKTWYAIGTSQGGKDVQGWTKFKGDNQVVPCKLPNGVPLSFTIKAQNQQGLESYLHCKLDTYDNTLPDGRVEASYKFSSHPGIIAATVIINDDSPVKTSYKALGLSPGRFGREIKDWTPLSLTKTTIRFGVSSDLRHFSSPRKGKLIVAPIESSIFRSPENCARKCLNNIKCVSFDYEQSSETCQLYDVIESHTNKLYKKGDFYNYERLGGGFSAFIEYQNQPLEHGMVYYVNVLIENTLEYRSALFSEGTLIDFTPPLTGYLGRFSRDVTVSHQCKASLRQRCEEVTGIPNHRLVVDGSDGRTVFNGNKPMHDTKYTLTNHYVTANWDGFADPESGIWGFTWAVGTTLCGQDIVQYEDPHKHISSPKYWTFSGFHEGVALQDGEYYVTVEALNNVVFGGAMVTTVCHSVPFTVDTTPPYFYNVTDVMFDEDFDILAAYYNISDRQSGISRVDFGLGTTKHDVGLRAYSRHGFMDRNDPYLVIENLELQPGIPAWVRLRAVNKVGLFASGHANAPIMVDKTPPIPGIVLDGNLLREDTEYQHDTKQICAQWQDFFDPESGIKRFLWGVGSRPKVDDIVAFRNISKFERHACAQTHLRHNATYFSTVVVLNDALNSRRSNSSSDGVLVDVTPPIPGTVDDRIMDSSFSDDIDFTSETATIAAAWQYFYDPESGIDHFDINIEVNNETAKFIPTITDKKFTDHSLTLRHLDFIKVEVSSANGAKLQTKVKSDGALVDHTPPNLHYIYDTENDTHFQSEKTKLHLKWHFSDPESGIAEYRYKIEEFDAGMKTTIFPEHGDFSTVEPKFQQVSVDLDELHLKDGALYKVHVVALNKARLSSSHVSDGVLVDTTPPLVKNVKLSMPSEEEDLDETDTYVLLASSDTLTASWLARDSESGIQTIKIGVGVARGDTSVTNGFVILNSGETHTTLHDLKMLYFKEEFPVYYYVSVKALNKAGLESNVMYSRPIKILHENVPGTVYDGRQAMQDNVYTRDKTSIGISFSGFESQTCNIIGYEWAVGTEPYLTDILTFTDYGIVMLNESEGHAQISLELYESQTYYATVRARTGQMCKQEFIMSVSDGITLDSNGPDISVYVNDNKYTSQQVVHQMKSIYQKITKNIDISWSVTDMSGIDIESWSVGSLPEREDIHDVTISKLHKIPLNSVSLNTGTANFVTIRAKDKAGNTAVLTSPAIIADMSVPEVKGFSCTKVLSSADSLLKCKWSLVADRESPITSLSYGISSSPLALDVLNFTDISVERRTWFRNIGSYIVNTDTEKIYMALKIQNAADHVFITEETAVIDRTPPIKGTIQIITRETFTSSNITTRCQVSEQNIEIEVKGFKDEESGLSRLEIGLGSKSGKTDILTFAKFEVRDYIFIDELQLYPGMEVFATVRVYNKVNLYSTSFSGSMVISPSPNLSVLDGSGQNDEDYSSQLNIIQGHWKYTDRCPLISAEWSVQDLAGNVIQKFKPIINANTHFLNDELRTENDKTYINIIRTTDALNRTRLARSDGITVRIQPPKISNVRDGLENEDINYQRSVSELTGNWDEFGDNTDKNPSQVIVRYEVSVGNDRRFPNTRTNIYPFVNVGLNRTVTFKNLNLKAKLVRYYLTVRAYSAAGSYVEGYSNGVSVGYEEIVQPGDLKYKEFQSSNHSIEMGWTDFISDYGIRHYEIAVGTAPPNTTNDTVDCNIFKANNIQFDIKPLSNVGLNTFAKIEGISLSHGKRYYVTILAEDETKSCLAVTSGPILIDTSKPTIGKVFLNNKETQKRYNFINTTHLKVSLKNFSDNESGILYYHILLAEKVDCSLTENLRHVVQEKRVNITEVTFYQLQEEKQYIIKLTVINSANLSSSVTTATIFLDKISPLTGNVKAGLDWQQPISMQQSLTTLNATILIAKTQNGYTCPLQNDISPSSHNLLSTWHPLKGDYAPKCVSVTTKGLRIEVKTDEHIFTEIVKGGVETNEMEMLEGSYTFKMKGLKGHHMVSSVSISRELSSIPFNFNDSLDDLKEPSELFDNNTSYEQPQDGMNRMSRPHRYGTGFFIPGYRIRNETYTWNILFWAADMYNLKYAWITTSFDPTEIEAKYDLTLMKENDTDALTWSVIFSVNDIEKATIDTMAFQNIGKVSIIGYNKNDFVPEVDDIFNPFYSEIKLSSVHIPSLKDTPCRYGKPFFDPEVGIHEIWAGVSNSQNETETIMQYALQKRYCLPCENKCPHDCDPDCSLDTTNPLEVLHITLSNLTMLPSSNKSREISSNITSGSDFTYFSTESYYINVKVVDFAGNVEEAISEAVIIDNTPPKFIQLSCVDPIHSLDEPTLYQGTNSSVAAMWDCEDDISEITKYTTCVGSSPGVCDIKPVDNIGLKTSVLIEGLSGLLHDGSTYFVTTTAYNAADMKTSESCNITVELELPMTSQSKSTEMFSIPVANALPNVAFSDRTDRLGIHWEGKNNDTEFYEWEIGSSGTTPDIFPRVKIGTKKSTKAAIIDGHLWLDGVNINTTVKEYVLKNWTEEEIAKAHAHGNFFNFEPGRCIHVNLYSVNRAHLSSKIYVKPICMKRKEDVLMNFEQKTLQKVTAIGKMLQTSHAGVIDGKADLELTANGSAGGILVGMLKTADVDGMYGSSASDTYRSFISSPLTKSKTSRLLRNRFRRYSGMSFYISPTGYTKLNDLIEVNIRFNNTENTFVAALIYWDQDSEEWRKVTEDCKTEEHIDYSTSSTSLYTAKVCLPSHLSATQRGRRSIDKSTVVNGPRQFSLVFISKEITQTQPIIKTESLFFKEDEASVQLRAIDVFDAENDNVTFQIVDYPKNGVANITSDGQLYYKPNPDFSGNDEVIVECKETTLPQSLKPSPVHAKINLFVTEVNDAPDLLFLRDNNTFTGDRRTEIILPFESNVTEYFIGTFVASDIDRNDSLTEKVFDSSNSEANLTLSEADDLNLLEKFKSLYTKDAVTVKMYQLQLSMSKDFFGVIDYGLIVHDNAGHWSLPIKLSIGVLYNPCVFGKCAPSKNLQCTDLARAKSFDNFHCKCQPGYEGVWCETETNECSPEPCALMFDCEDLVAKFKCNINMPKLFAILICSLLAVGAVCFVVYRKKQQLNKNMKVSNIDLHDLNRYKCPQVEHFSGKYGHNVFDKEQDEQTPEFNDDVTASQTDDDSVELQEVKKSKNMLQGLPLASAGTLRPPHLKSSILTHFKSKMTPIDN